MKIIVLIASLVFACSCVSGPKHGMVEKAMILKAQSGSKKFVKIKVWENKKRAGSKPFAFVRPGDRVLVIKFDGAMALIELPDEKRGWIRKVFVPVP